MSESHSTGRGGAGNIGKDPIIYTDGSIVREGIVGEPAAPGEYSTGRGGMGNMKVGPAGEAVRDDTRRTDVDVIPEPAMRNKHQEVFHTGRGGQGNVHKDKYGGHSKPQSAEHMEKFHGGASEPQGEQGKKNHQGIGEKVKHLFEGK